MPAFSLNSARDFPGPGIVQFNSVPPPVTQCSQLVFPLTGNTVISGGSGESPDIAIWQFNPEGTITRAPSYQVDDPTYFSGWTPNPVPGIGNGYWIRATPIGATAPTSGPIGVWTPLSSAVAWTYASHDPGGGIYIEIASDSAGANIVTHGPFYYAARTRVLNPLLGGTALTSSTQGGGWYFNTDGSIDKLDEGFLTLDEQRWCLPPGLGVNGTDGIPYWIHAESLNANLGVTSAPIGVWIPLDSIILFYADEGSPRTDLNIQISLYPPGSHIITSGMFVISPVV